MKKNAILFFLLFLTSSVFSQTKFGNVTKGELDMTSYTEDTTAVAVVLAKKGRLKFILNNNEGTFQFEYVEEKRVKILKPEGLNYVADNAINYYVGSRTAKEEIRNLSGTTYNLENGKIVKTKLTKEHVFDEDIDGKFKVKKFTMPAAKVGSVIEYKYTLISDFFYELKDFYFQEGIPIHYVDFEAVIPEYFNYNLNTQGYISMDVSKKQDVSEQFRLSYKDSDGKLQSGNINCNSVKFTFAASKVPSMKEEPMLWTVNDYISKVSFELRSTRFPGGVTKPVTTTWENVDKELMERASFGSNLKNANWFKKEVKEGELTLENAYSIERMIKERVKWNERNGVFSSNLKKALNEGVGSCADMNFLLINALKAAGFNAFPVILSTRSNGKLPIANPSISAFNCMIAGVQIDEKLYFTDASTKYGTWNVLPPKCIVDKARVLDSKTNEEWVDLTALNVGTIFKQRQVKFTEEGCVQHVKESRRGNDALHARTSYFRFENQEKFIQSYEENNRRTLSDFSLTGHDDNAEVLVLEYVEKDNRKLGSEFIYYTPPISKVFRENPFTAETRTYPINFDYFQNYVQMVDVEIPEGYEVVEYPQEEGWVLGDRKMVYMYSVKKQDNLLKFNIAYQLRCLLLLPNEYDDLKDFITKIINKTEEQIVFKKVGDKANTGD